MSDSVVKKDKVLSAIAISQENDRFKAVELRKQDGRFELLWAKSSEDDDRQLDVFAARSGLSIEQAETDSNRIGIVGFNCAGVAFYRIWMPVVKEKELAAMVKLQTETRLPLRAEEVELAWRKGRVRDEEVAVTVAAAKRQRLQEFIEVVRNVEPAKILLDCEGIVEVWIRFFGGDVGSAAVVSIGARSTQVCLAEDGRLSNAAILDMGTEDFEEGLEDEQTEAAGGFAQDIRSVLELFGYAEPAELPVFVLSDGGIVVESIVSLLKSSGLDASIALPELKELRTPSEISAEEFYNYRVPIGLALAGLEERAEELNLFERLYQPLKEEKKKHWLYSPKVVYAIAAVMLVVLVIVSYAIDVASPGAIEKRLKTSSSDTDISLLVQRQKLLRTVASERANLLELLEYINSSAGRGILLDTFHFKKGQPVSISGQVDNPDLLYKFQESLLTKKDIKNVEIPNASKDPKGDKFKFTVTFHYRNFTKKAIGT
jgi:hypothetical protein